MVGQPTLSTRNTFSFSLPPPSCKHAPFPPFVPSFFTSYPALVPGQAMHADAELTLIFILCLVLATLALPTRFFLVWSSSSSSTARSVRLSPPTVASSAEASPSKKRKPTSNAQGSSSSQTPPAPLLSSSSSSSTSSTSSALPFRVLPANPLENSFARAREIADTKRRRSAPKDSHSHSHSHSSHGSSRQSDMSIDSHPNYFSAAAGLGASSARPALGRPGSRTSDVGLSGSSAGGLKSSAPPVRRTGVQGKQPVKKLVIKNFTGKKSLSSSDSPLRNDRMTDMPQVSLY